MNQTLLIIIGGGFGSAFRYWVSLGSYRLWGTSYPYGTLVVNVLGSLIMGFLTILFLQRYNGQADQLRALLLVGFLGGFTTFSSFSIETLMLLQGGELIKGLLNIFASISLCLIAVWLGATVGRQL